MNSVVRIILQLLISIGLFFGLYIGLKQINFIENLQIDEFTKENEKKLGELIYEYILFENDEVSDDTLQNAVSKMLNDLCESNDIDVSDITLHVIESSEINAYTLPGDIIVVASGLISESRSGEELAGVLAHELAHVQLDHAVKKLAREVGIQVLIGTLSGSTGGETIGELAKLSTSTAFEREQETEADSYAVSLLFHASIDSRGLSDFLLRMSMEDQDVPMFQWLRTHPGGEERSLSIRKEASKLIFDPVSAYKGDWQKIRKRAGWDPLTLN